VAYPVDEFDDDPKPDKRDRGRPLSSYGPDEAPQAKRHKRDVENDEAALKIGGDQATHGSSRRKYVIETADILLD
jgi:hypothetical protein